MSAATRIVAIVPAAGLGVRMAGLSRAPISRGEGRPAQGAAPPKQLLELDGVPILFLTLRKLAACARLGEIIVAVRAHDRVGIEARLGKENYAKRVVLVEGGESRHDSVAKALARVPAGTELVLVHDAVRPFVEPALIERVIDAAADSGAAILGLPATDTLKQVEPATGAHASRILATIPRERIVLAQTPQVFRLSLLREAFERAAADDFRGPDEAVLVERLGHPVTVIMGSEHNLKITTPASLELARALLAQEQKT